MERQLDPNVLSSLSLTSLPPPPNFIPVFTAQVLRHEPGRHIRVVRCAAGEDGQGSRAGRGRQRSERERWFFSFDVKCRFLFSSFAPLKRARSPLQSRGRARPVRERGTNARKKKGKRRRRRCASSLFLFCRIALTSLSLLFSSSLSPSPSNPKAGRARGGRRRLRPLAPPARRDLGRPL